MTQMSATAAALSCDASLPGLTRQTIFFMDAPCEVRWMRGSGPRMTDLRTRTADRPIANFVIAGLDPAIHHSRMTYWTYILANAPGGTLYVGMTKDLVRRVYEHREGFADGFTRKYKLKQLVYYEAHDTAAGAIQREKNIKHWPREWKIDLIIRENPQWRDLYDDIVR